MKDYTMEVTKFGDKYKWTIYDKQFKVIKIGQADTSIGACIAMDRFIRGKK